jgi:DNA-binding MarR family transcriptional regulator
VNRAVLGRSAGSGRRITPRGRELITTAAPLHVADVRDVIVDHLTARELQTLITIGAKVSRRLAALEQ